MKKPIWNKVAVAEAYGSFAVELDGRPMRTPAKAPLVLPTHALAEIVAAEWRAQDGKPDPATMPATRMANAAIDKVTEQFDEVAGVVAAYGDSDLLCYRATAPVELVDRQVKKWDPLLDWAADALGARLKPVSGIMHAPQDPAALSSLADGVSALTPFELAAFHDLVAISGSLIVGFAASKRLLGLEELWACACLDEIWQEEQWGRDEDAVTLRERKKQDFFDASQFFAACE
ncbi:MAG: ATPase [Rhodobacteraceae bacterium]|nr:ATPase [Paracoccaceae bacterium]